MPRPDHWQPDTGAELPFQRSPPEHGLRSGSFVRDRYRHHDQRELIYRWPLFFASGHWGTDYAWTVLGHTEQRRHKHKSNGHRNPFNGCPLCVEAD